MFHLDICSPVSFFDVVYNFCRKSLWYLSDEHIFSFSFFTFSDSYLDSVTEIFHTFWQNVFNIVCCRFVVSGKRIIFNLVILKSWLLHHQSKALPPWRQLVTSQCFHLINPLQVNNPVCTIGVKVQPLPHCRCIITASLQQTTLENIVTKGAISPFATMYSSFIQ